MTFYVKPTEDTVFPASCGAIAVLEWSLRYTDAIPTKQERMFLASVLNAYRYLINECTQKMRNEKCSAIKRLSQSTKGDK